MLKYITQFEETFLSDEKVSERLKENYNRSSINNDAGIKVKYGILTRYNSKKNNGSKTDSEKENESENEFFNANEIKKLFKQLKITFDKSNDEKLIKVITEQNSELTEFIATSKVRKLQLKKDELLKLKKEYEQKQKDIDNEIEELSI
jgi:thiol:disulfide interchange protein